jgi:hypothetical protein
MAWSFDHAGSRYIFKYDDRSDSPRPRTHGREPSLTGGRKDANTISVVCRGLNGVRTPRFHAIGMTR